MQMRACTQGNEERKEKTRQNKTKRRKETKQTDCELWQHFETAQQ